VDLAAVVAAEGSKAAPGGPELATQPPWAAQQAPAAGEAAAALELRGSAEASRVPEEVAAFMVGAALVAVDLTQQVMAGPEPKV
jgi:hypothetical protein